MTKKRNLNHAQFVKKKLRDTKEWKQLRIDIADEYDNTDPITNKRLLKGWNLHHLAMDEETYDDLEDHSHFRPLNRQTHDVIHWLFRYYQKDPEILERIAAVLKEMEELN